MKHSSQTLPPVGILTLSLCLLQGAVLGQGQARRPVQAPAPAGQIEVPTNTFVYAAPSGNDANSGSTSSQPVQSFARAAQIAASHGPGTVVVFADGEYVFDSTVTLDTQHNGITFRAAQGATPVFSSLIQVTGWTPFNGPIVQAPLPNGVSHVRFLRDLSEEWMERSASAMFTSPLVHPNNGLGNGGAGVNESRSFDPGQPQLNKSLARFDSALSPLPDWSVASQYDLRAHQTPWSVNIVPIASVSGDEIALQHAATYEMLATDEEDGSPGATQMWILNSIEGIDTPGEWAVIDGTVYLYPKSGTGDIYVPTLTELIKVDAGGDGNTWSGAPVRNIVFEGITFTGLDYLVTGAQGTPVSTAGQPTTNPGVITTQHDWGIVDGPASALRFRNAEDCVVTACSFRNSGSGGVRLDRHAQRITIEECDFRSLGREAILLGGRGPGYGDVNRDNEIASNLIVQIGREKWDCPAINVDQSSNNWIHHNHIEDIYMSALHLTSTRSVYLGFLAYAEADTYYEGRECHFWEVAPSVVNFILDNEDTLGFTESKVEAQQFVYNYNNRFENNLLQNVHNLATLSNGLLYVSGGTRHASNFLTHNYITESYGDTQILYTDSYIDDLAVRGNMVHDVTNGIIWDYNGWYEDSNNYGGVGTFTANILQDSTTAFYISGLPAANVGITWVDEGNLFFNSIITDNTPPVGSMTGNAAQLAEYQSVLDVLTSQDLPDFTSLPGVAAMQTSLENVIQSLGGTIALNNATGDRVQTGQ